jgi:hypothetical protein
MASRTWPFTISLEGAATALDEGAFLALYDRSGALAFGVGLGNAAFVPEVDDVAIDGDVIVVSLEFPVAPSVPVSLRPGGRVYQPGTYGAVAAFSTSGAVLWEHAITGGPAEGDPLDADAVVVADGRVYVGGDFTTLTMQIGDADVVGESVAGDGFVVVFDAEDGAFIESATIVGADTVGRSVRDVSVVDGDVFVSVDGAASTLKRAGLDDLNIPAGGNIVRFGARPSRVLHLGTSARAASATRVGPAGGDGVVVVVAGDRVGELIGVTGTDSVVIADFANDDVTTACDDVAECGVLGGGAAACCIDGACVADCTVVNVGCDDGAEFCDDNPLGSGLCGGSCFNAADCGVGEACARGVCVPRCQDVGCRSDEIQRCCIDDGSDADGVCGAVSVGRGLGEADVDTFDGASWRVSRTSIVPTAIDATAPINGGLLVVAQGRLWRVGDDGSEAEIVTDNPEFLIGRVRMAMTVVRASDGREIAVIFGGETKGITGDTLTVDLAVPSFVRPRIAAPPPRTRAVMTADGATAVLAGGEGFAGLLADSWRFNVDTIEWTEIPGPLPPVADAGLVTTSAGVLRLGGEAQFGTSSDVFVLDGDAWIQRPSLLVPMAIGRSAATLGGTIWLYGFDQISGGGGLFVYDVETGVSSAVRRGDEPSPRVGASLQLSPAGLHLLGGDRVDTTCVEFAD